jgi:hypothetical protein
MPILVDGEDHRADVLFACWLERLYLIDFSGGVVYEGNAGSFGFHLDELDGWLSRHPPRAIGAS